MVKPLVALCLLSLLAISHARFVDSLVHYQDASFDVSAYKTQLKRLVYQSTTSEDQWDAQYLDFPTIFHSCDPNALASYKITHFQNYCGRIVARTAIKFPTDFYHCGMLMVDSTSTPRKYIYADLLGAKKFTGAQLDEHVNKDQGEVPTCSHTAQVRVFCLEHPGPKEIPRSITTNGVTYNLASSPTDGAEGFHNGLKAMSGLDWWSPFAFKRNNDLFPTSVKGLSGVGVQGDKLHKHSDEVPVALARRSHLRLHGKTNQETNLEKVVNWMKSYLFQHPAYCATSFNCQQFTKQLGLALAPAKKISKRNNHLISLGNVIGSLKDEASGNKALLRAYMSSQT